MYQQLHSSDILDITYRTDTCLVISRWMRAVTPGEMRAGYETILQAARPLTCRHWLLDIRRRSHSDEATARWTTEEFLPRAVRDLGGTLYVAVLLSPLYRHELDARPALAQLPATAGLPYRLQYFTDEKAANDWLLQNTGH